MCILAGLYFYLNTNAIKIIIHFNKVMILAAHLVGMQFLENAQYQ